MYIPLAERWHLRMCNSVSILLLDSRLSIMCLSPSSPILFWLMSRYLSIGKHCLMYSIPMIYRDAMNFKVKNAELLMNNSCSYILYVDLVVIIYYYGIALLTFDTCSVLLVSIHRLYVSHSLMVVCYLCVALVVLWIWFVSNKIWHLLEHFISLHINLLTSSTE